jgi:hypothetical protein
MLSKDKSSPFAPTSPHPSLSPSTATSLKLFCPISIMIAPGEYSWTYGGGQFAVCLRPSGVFYCSEYPAVATWEAITDEGVQKLLINWKNFGKYELKVTAEGVLEGWQVGKPNNWRKMQFLRPFNDVETLMMGAGGII